MTDHWIAGIEAAGRLRYQLFFTDTAGTESAFEFRVEHSGYLTVVRHSAAFDRACTPYASAASELPQIVRFFRGVEYFGARALALRPEPEETAPSTYRLVLAGPDMVPFEGSVEVVDVDPRHPVVRIDEGLRGILGGPFATEESVRALATVEALVLRFDWQRAHPIDLALEELPDGED